MLFKFLLISLMATVLLFDEASANTCPKHWVKLNDDPVCFEAKDQNEVIMLFKFLLMSLMATVLMSDEASANTCPKHWVKLNEYPVCFGTRDSQFGKFTVKTNIAVSSLMLVHRLGAVNCQHTTKARDSNWGCNRTSIGAVLTDHQNSILAPPSIDNEGWYLLPGYTSNSPVLEFCQSFTFSASDELRLWYGEDLRGSTESNNAGTSCADVYGLVA
ncbi:hypothetical protein ACROYT_G043588 [Oculina patagonica]